jgi:hypothetical protein
MKAVKNVTHSVAHSRLVRGDLSGLSELKSMAKAKISEVALKASGQDDLVDDEMRSAHERLVDLQAAYAQVVSNLKVACEPEPQPRPQPEPQPEPSPSPA